MAFNFNWSPLAADEHFYARARDLLTKALNKSPKPPIIVDDILVSEFNLGTVPPDLEILEIGDLAEDRFRGIFKMCYTGDAYLTLKTRVQANPLNTYLDSKPSFTSPKPLAASSGLTIPISISLSEFKLSAIIILVFSKQKGLTIVFRNDPLESLKVSSTFDSIQFVRDYLQRTIEQQLRNLMMDELPAIIHRLSLQLWCPDQAAKGTESDAEPADENAVNPFASPPTDPVDARGNLLDPQALSDLALNGGSEAFMFSQKNLLRLASLTDSHRTLSLFTPNIRDVVFRAWSGYGDRNDAQSAAAVMGRPSLARTLSAPGSSTVNTYTFSDTASSSNGHLPSRPSLVSLGSAASGLALGAHHRSRPGRKKKTRVVDLRKRKVEADDVSEAMSDTVSAGAPQSEPVFSPSVSSDPEAALSDLGTSSRVRFRPDQKLPTTPIRSEILASLDAKLHSSSPLMNEIEVEAAAPVRTEKKNPEKDSAYSSTPAGPAALQRISSHSDTSSVILEQAWIMKMAGEIARRVYDEEKSRQGPSPAPNSWDQSSEAPPAYEAATH